jgi:DNA-binding transcriptional LysR family regulator
MRALVGAGAVATAISLLLPWIDGLDDGGPYTVAGYEARPLFTVAIVAVCVAELALARRYAWAAAPVAGVGLALIRWVVHHNDYYSRPDLDYGIWLCAAAQAVVLLASVIETARRARAGA